MIILKIIRNLVPAIQGSLNALAFMRVNQPAREHIWKIISGRIPNNVVEAENNVDIVLHDLGPTAQASTASQRQNGIPEMVDTKNTKV